MTLGLILFFPQSFIIGKIAIANHPFFAVASYFIIQTYIRLNFYCGPNPVLGIDFY